MHLWEPNCMMGFRTQAEASEHFGVDLCGNFWEAAHVSELFGGPLAMGDDDDRQPYQQPPCSWWLESVMDCPSGPVGKGGRCLAVTVRPCEIVLPGDMTLDVAAWFMRAELCTFQEHDRPSVVVEGVVALVDDDRPSGVWWRCLEAAPFVGNV